jgi:hypothetical protein
MDMRKLLEAVTKFAGEPEQKPGEQWKGTDSKTPGKKLVGDSIIKDLAKGPTPKTKEQELAEAYAKFLEDNLGVEEKRPSRKGSRPARDMGKTGEPSKRYTSVEEGWATGSDRVSLPDEPSTYWAGNGALQADYNRLYDELVPSQGKADTIEGEVLRASSKIVYRYYNDGDEFNQASFDQLEPYIGAVTSYDDLAHKAVEFALKANGNYTPNPNWDSLDVMDYGPVDDDYDDEEDDDYDDWSDDVDNEEDDEDVYEDGASVKYGVYKRGGSIGERKGLIKTFDTKEEAQEYAKRQRRHLSPGERKYYKLGYTVKAVKPGEEVDEGRGDSKGLHKKVTIVKGPDAGKTGYVRQIKTDRIRNRVYLDLDLEDGSQAVVLKQDVRLVKDLAEGYTGRETKDGVWRVFKDGQGGSVAGPFKSAEEANSWIKKQHQGVAEGMEEFAKAQAAKRAAARKQKSQTKEGQEGGHYVIARRRTDGRSAIVKKDGVEEYHPTKEAAIARMDALNAKTINPHVYYTYGGNHMSEGWESGPEERTRSHGSDPDDAYDAMRQEKADAEAQAQQAKRPQEQYYTLVGRGPNMEPNYAFPGEYATQDEADSARSRLMADPKTPNPRDIGISKRTRYLDLKEGIESADPVEGAVLSAVQELIQQGHTEVAPEVITNMVVAATSQPFLLKDLVDANKKSPAIQHYVDSINPTKVKFSSDILTVKNEDPMKDKKQAQAGVSNMAARAANRNRLGESSTPLRDREDYDAKSKALQDIQMDPSTSQDPQLSAELARRKAELVKQAQALGISESRAHKLIANKLKQMELQRQMGSPESDEAYAKHIDSVKKSSAEYVKNTPNTIYKREVDEAGSAVGGGATGSASNTGSAGTAALNPDTVKQTTAALNTFKAATGSNAPAPNIAKALDAVTQGTAVGGSEMKILEPIMKDIATVATDPKLAGQFKTLAGQVNQTQQKQQQAK